MRTALLLGAMLCFVFFGGYLLGRLGQGDSPRKNFELLVQLATAFGTIAIVIVTVQLALIADQRADQSAGRTRDAEKRTDDLRMDVVHQNNAVASLQSVEESIAESTVAEQPKGKVFGQLRNDYQVWDDIAELLMRATNDVKQIKDPAMTVIYYQRRRITLRRVKAALTPEVPYSLEYFRPSGFDRARHVDPDSVNVMFKFAFDFPLVTQAVKTEPYPEGGDLGRTARDEGIDGIQQFLDLNRNAPSHPYQEPTSSSQSKP